MRSDDPGGRAPATDVTSPRPRPVSLFGALLYYVPSYGVAIVGYLAINSAAARILGTADYGYFVVLFTATILVGQFSLLGVQRSGLREAARADDLETVGRLLVGVRAVLLVPLPLASVATAATVWALRGGDARAATAALTGVLVFLAGYQKINANFLWGLGHVRAATMLTGRSGGPLIALVQALFVVAVLVLVPGWGLPGVLAGLAAGYVLPLTWGTWLLRRRWPASTRSHRTLHDLRSVAKRDWRFAASHTGSFLGSTLELWLAALILSGGATSLFAAAHRVAHLLVVPASSLNVVFSPALARLAKRDDHGHMEALVRTAATVSTVVSGILWVPMVVVPGIILTLVFGTGFHDAVAALVLLATGYLMSAVSGPSLLTLSMSHHEGDVARIHWATVVLRIVSGVVCAWLWGVTGLAASSAAMGTLKYAVSWWAVRRRLSISTHVTLRPRLSLLGRISS